MKFEKTPKGITHTVNSMVGEVVQKLVYTFQVDSKDYPADVQMAVNTVAFKKVDANTFERTGKYQGMVTETVKYTLSNGGKTLTTEHEAIGEIKRAGYDVFLVLEATIGFNKRDEENGDVSDEGDTEVRAKHQPSAHRSALEIQRSDHHRARDARRRADLPPTSHAACVEG